MRMLVQTIEECDAPTSQKGIIARRRTRDAKSSGNAVPEAVLVYSLTARFDRNKIVCGLSLRGCVIGSRRKASRGETFSFCVTKHVTVRAFSFRRTLVYARYARPDERVTL